MPSSVPLQGLAPPPFRRLCAAPVVWLLLFTYVLGRGWFLLGYLPTYGNPSDPYALGWDLDVASCLLNVVAGTSLGLAVLYAVAYPVLQGLNVLLGQATWPVSFDWRGLLGFVILVGAVVGVRVMWPGQFDWVTD